MLGLVGRVSVFLLVILVAAIAARAFFEHAPTPDEIIVASPPPPLPLAPRADPEPTPTPITIIDPDPDLDQNVETADCPGALEPPAEPMPKDPAPH